MSETEPQIKVVLDIDQTLAGGVVPAHMRHYNEVFELGMTEEEIAATALYPKTFDVPQLITYQAQGPEAKARFMEERNKIRTSPEVHLGLTELPGSVDGVHSLLNVGDVSYYTVRPPEVEEATHQWLREKSFPNPERVVLCENHKDKLMRIIADQLIPPGKEGKDLPTVILIDDSMKQLIEAANALVQEDPEMKRFIEHIILVGFGVSRDTMSLEGAFYPETGLRTLALPNWEQQNLQTVMQSVIA